MPLFAYSVVLRDKKGDLKHYINHCKANSKQEARGIAHEEFEDNYKDCKIASLLIQEITDILPSELQTHCYENTRVKSEFSLPDKLS